VAYIIKAMKEVPEEALGDFECKLDRKYVVSVSVEKEKRRWSEDIDAEVSYSYD
jgi:hypothetical protein